MFKSCVNPVGSLMKSCVRFIVYLVGFLTNNKNCAQIISYASIFANNIHIKSTKNISIKLLKNDLFTQYPQGLLKLLLL